jgi:hypothetical protein
LGAVVLILKDTGSALGFVMFKERLTFCVRGPWRMANVRKEEEGRRSKGKRKDARLNPIELLG